MTTHRPPSAPRFRTRVGLSATYNTSLARIVANAVHRMLTKCEAYGERYAAGADRTPDDVLERLLEYAAREHGNGSNEVVGDLAGYRCGASRREPRDRKPGETAEARDFRLRHALGHVLDAHTPVSRAVADSQDWYGYEESVADLFALMDLLPDATLDEWAAQGRTESEMMWAAFCETKRYCPRWSKARIEDRLRLRFLFASLIDRSKSPVTF